MSGYKSDELMTTKKIEELLEQIEELQYENAQLKKCKRYGLVWEEKEEKFEKKAKNALPILKEKGGKFKDIKDKQNPDDDYNILIEGDNFHSLSVLNYTHRKKIDVIYIDPPYNTGKKDFIYNDHFVDREDCFRHSKWLSFMSKRLKLAKNLLKDDGIIFISIDDNEFAQLKMLCDDIFSENNFITMISWQGMDTVKNDAKYFSSNHEHILVYSINKDKVKIKGLKRSAKHNKVYKNLDNDPKGDYLLTPLHAKSGTKGKIFKFVFNNGVSWQPPQGTFPRFSVPTLKELDDSHSIYFGKNNKSIPQKKTYLKDVSDYVKLTTFWDYKFAGSTRQSNKELADIIYKGAFQNPKPSSLIKILVNSVSKKNSIILDFMAGSGTTGHAVLALNKEDGGNRKFILCTNNENKICENVTWERIKRVSKGYKKQNGDKVEGLGGNLKYLKTDFIKIDNNSDNLKEKTVEASTEILCFRENTFNKVIDDYKKHKIKVFESKNKYTAILFDLFYFDEFIAELKKLKDKKVSIYVFSYTKDFSASEFGDLKIDFTVEAIPEKVLETYKKIFNF